ncbi:MAG: sensor histidine kinase [Janthinobacterium lividum]
MQAYTNIMPKEVDATALQENARVEGERRLWALVNASSDAVYRMSADWDIMYQLKTHEQGSHFLVDTAEANPHWLAQYIHPDDQPRVRAAIERAIQGKTVFDLEHRVWQADGGLGWTHSRAVPVLSGDGDIQEWFGMATDVTEVKRAADSLVQNEKLAAMGRLAASIAHEVNNPMGSVANLIFLARLSDNLSEVRDYLDKADQELGRAIAISNQTLRFYKQSSNPTAIGPAALLAEVLLVHRGRVNNANVQVEERFRGQALVCCYEGEIRQVLSNLIGNATDAMRLHAGGRLLLRTREGCSWQTGERGVFITVADTGAGMSRDTQRKAFEAFYTTKGMDGTGLGLWVSKEIIERHRGELRLRSSEKPERHGTVFKCFLPFQAVQRCGT